jgi:hypothetical protein
LTLLEVILALGLTVIVMLLLGGLIAIYQGSLDIGRDNVRQARIARAILAMIADDLRGVIRNSQQDDAASLKEFLSSTSSTPGSTAGGAQGAAGQQGGASVAGSSAGSSTGSSSGTDGLSAGGSTDATDPMTESASTASQPGVYGSESSIEIDVSRPPRIEEYAAELANPLSGTLTDIPSDIKTVSYYVQPPQLDGIQDPLAGLTGPSGPGVAGASLMQNGGLVRRAIDRGVYRWAAENGQIAQVNKTGQLVAPEIVALSFSYFDGQQWTTTWDSSTSGIPWAVNISIYMQHAKAARDNPIQPGISMIALNSGVMADAGIEMYSMMVNIPGAQSLLTPAEQQSTTTTDASSTSALGF